jgi:hypothetical protein
VPVGVARPDVGDAVGAGALGDRVYGVAVWIAVGDVGVLAEAQGVLMARTDPRPHYGRKRRVREDGYVDIYEPEHPLARRDGYVFEHRKVAYDAGMAVRRGYDVHHVNGDRADNRVENLEVILRAEHTRRHAALTRKTHCKHGHEFTPDNTWLDRMGWRHCKACNRESQRARNARIAAEMAA